MDSAVHQLASASVATAFSIGMIFAAHLFTEYRSSRMPAVSIARPLAGSLHAGSRLSIESVDFRSLSVNRSNGAI